MVVLVNFMLETDFTPLFLIIMISLMRDGAEGAVLVEILIIRHCGREVFNFRAVLVKERSERFTEQLYATEDQNSLTNFL